MDKTGVAITKNNRLGVSFDENLHVVQSPMLGGIFQYCDFTISSIPWDRVMLGSFQRVVWNYSTRK